MCAGAGVVLSPIQEEVHFPCCLDNRLDMLSNESILLYLSVAGSMIPIPVLESESIASVKLMIQTCKGFIVKVQKPVFGGRKLAHDESLIKNKDYSVAGGDVLLLALKLSDLQALNIVTACREEFEVQVDKYRNVGYLKKHTFSKDDDKQQQFLVGGDSVDDHRLRDSISKDNDGAIHLLVKNPTTVRATPVEKDVELSVVASDICCHRRQENDEKQKSSEEELRVLDRKPSDTDFWLEPVVINPKTYIPSPIWDLIRSTFDGLAKGNQPIRSTEGTGGTYFMRDGSGHKIVAVFKPMDEEPMAVNNPGGGPTSGDGVGLKKGTRVGEGALREVAAYVLDHPKNGPRSLTSEVMGFSGVPSTPMVRCLHKGFNHPQGYDGSPSNVKIGSLQMFRENDGNCEDIGPQAFRVDEVHKISVLDIRLANADRHAGNILYRSDPNNGRIELIPIDHGYCIPDSFEDCTFDWLYWPQAQQPFSEETLNYIKSLDAEEDLALLKFLGWEVPNECARVLQISTMLLKKGAERGLTPFDIGCLMCRATLNEESMIEEIIHQVEESQPPCTSEKEFIQTVSNLMDTRLDQLKKN